MFSQLKPDFSSDRNQVIDFIPPQRHDGKNSYIWFSQIDPMTGRLKRKKYMLDRFKPGKERDFASNRIIANIYNKVLHGWNVWAPTNTNRSDTAITDVIERYRTYITNIQKKGVLKQKTFYDYSSRLRVLEEYIRDCVVPVRVCHQLDQAFWTDFFDP